MQTLADTQPDRRKDGGEAVLRQAKAYRQLFSGHGSKADAEIVLSDMAVHTGFYQITPAARSSEELRFREGQRDAFAHILEFLRMTDAEMADLEVAARRESRTTYT